MKRVLLNIALLMPLSLLVVSCKKQATVSAGSTITFIKSVTLDRSCCTVNSFLLSDGNYILLGKDPANTNPGLMVKVDINGNILWQKSISPLITNLWKAMPIAGNIFIAAGFDNTPSDQKLNIVSYDNNGNITSTHTLLPGKGCPKFSLDMIPLSDGGFAFSGSVWDRDNFPIPFLIITDKSFNELYSKQFEPLNGEYQYAISGICQSTDGAINMAGFFNNTNYADNTFLIRSYYDAVQKSFTSTRDSFSYQTPGCIAMGSNGGFVIANSRANIMADSGALVNYKNTYLDVISGTIGINILDAEGNFTGTVQYSGYPNNGFINSIKATSDGGYILCGTVNQLNAVDFSNTEIFVMKIDGKLNKQWSNTYDTSYPSFGVDGFQTSDGGYLISGYHLSFGKNYTMVLIKTDANGNVN